MRLAGIRTLAEANLFLEGYWPEFNRQFTKPARDARDVHQPLPRTLNLREIFCLKGTRTINSGYLVRWHGRTLALQNPTLAMRRRTVQVLEHEDGRIVIRFLSRNLEHRPVDIQERQAPPVCPPKPKKPKPGKYIPPPDHPWRRSNRIIHREWAQGIF